MRLAMGVISSGKSIRTAARSWAGGTPLLIEVLLRSQGCSFSIGRIVVEGPSVDHVGHDLKLFTHLFWCHGAAADDVETVEVVSPYDVIHDAAIYMPPEWCVHQDSFSCRSTVT